MEQGYGCVIVIVVVVVVVIVVSLLSSTCLVVFIGLLFVRKELTRKGSLIGVFQSVFGDPDSPANRDQSRQLKA